MSLHAFGLGMALVIVRMYATLRKASGLASVVVEAGSLPELYDALRLKFGPEMEGLLGASRAPFSDLVVLVNGVNVTHDRLPRVRLQDKDEVALFPPISGG
ncbi:MAG: MoaD/ThiS family protein [Methanobacteriota archaeon]|nr:MAG: MoaD/ThiS family protein [Euryarchaeota archaeon]